MISGGVSFERPREIRLAEMLLIGGVAIDSVQHVLQFDEWMDGVGAAVGAAVALGGPMLCVVLILLATRLHSRAAVYALVALVAIGAVISVADYMIQGEPTIGWLMGWAALALQIAATRLLLSPSARRWFARRATAVA